MSTSDKVDSEKEPQPEPKKKRPYEPPKLERWGTLAEVTKAVGAKAASDGASKGPRNTSFQGHASSVKGTPLAAKPNGDEKAVDRAVKKARKSSPKSTEAIAKKEGLIRNHREVGAFFALELTHGFNDTQPA